MAVTIGIIGVGYWGPNLVKNFYKNEDCNLLYICDKDKNVLKKISSQYPSLKTETDAQILFNDKKLQAVVIATPSNTHAMLTSRALKAGKHVLVEKPFTLTKRDAKKLIKQSKKVNRIIMVGHTYEYHPAIIKIKEYIETKTLGEIYYIYCSRVNMGKVREETNALWNLAPHDISILKYLLGKMPIAVAAFGQSYLSDNHEDVVFVHLRFPNNIIVHIHVSWLDPSKERKMTIVGSKKMVLFDDMDNESNIKIYDKGFIKLQNEKGHQIFKEFSLKLRPGDIVAPYIESKEPLYEECAHFINAIKNKTVPRSDGKNGLAVVTILEAAEKSLKSGGKWIRIFK